MAEVQMGAVEAKFADMIWKNEPITASELSVLSRNELNWKKTTTYTVLKRLCDKGIFRNENGTVTSIITKQEYDSLQTTQFIENSFAGSLPAFIAAFTKSKKLTDEERKEIIGMIENSQGD